jgi:hypothetical protein
VMAVALFDHFGGVLLAACHAPCQELPPAVWAAGDIAGSRPPGRCRRPRGMTRPSVAGFNAPRDSINAHYQPPDLRRLFWALRRAIQRGESVS